MAEKLIQARSSQGKLSDLGSGADVKQLALDSLGTLSDTLFKLAVGGLQGRLQANQAVGDSLVEQMAVEQAKLDEGLADEEVTGGRGSSLGLLEEQGALEVGRLDEARIKQVFAKALEEHLGNKLGRGRSSGWGGASGCGETRIDKRGGQGSGFDILRGGIDKTDWKTGVARGTEDGRSAWRSARRSAG